MGCCTSKTEKEPESDCFKMIRLGSSQEFQETFKKFLKKNGPDSINEITTIFRDQKYNPLAYCGILGNAAFFSAVIGFGGSVDQMEKLLEMQGIYLIDVIFMNGYLDLLKIYLPYYLKRKPRNSDDFSYLNIINKRERTLSPIQIASKLGHLEVIKYVSRYFSKDIPAVFDVHVNNEKTGENCALIACAEGQFETVKFLFEECRVDFYGLNYCNENAIMIAVAGMAKKMTYSYVEVVRYLVEVVAVDLLYNYEEVLISAQLPSLVEYLEYQLMIRGINTTKAHLERKSDLFHRVVLNDTETEVGTFVTPSMMNVNPDCTKVSSLSSIGFGKESFYSDFFKESELVMI